MLRLSVICVALVMGACEGGEAEKLQRARDRVCACETAACAEAALDGVPKGKVETSPKSQRIAREMLDCLAALYEEGRPTQDPDAPIVGPDEPGQTEDTDPAAARRP